MRTRRKRVVEFRWTALKRYAEMGDSLLLPRTRKQRQPTTGGTSALLSQLRPTRMVASPPKQRALEVRCRREATLQNPKTGCQVSRQHGNV